MRFWLALCLSLVLTFWAAGPSWASLADDHFDGNIFPLYAGNGSLVPPRTTLAESLRRQRPALLVFYTDDSRDCKQYSIVVSQLQAFYGRAVSIMPLIADTIDPDHSRYTPQDAGYYYRGQLPQTVLIGSEGQVLLDEVGQVPYEKTDAVLRKVFSLPERNAQDETLVPRAFNEFNSELARPDDKRK
ncbi:thylakoid membrane photosystem I accumulation factor [Leptolyngbya sp. FACHB-261]|uniref:thylakoid membrane photosystem I accumulation factor n=1 Tax=Leptolyngbya sp. FACHB-261 TaxID=2692806 RepID=UPI0016854D6D|nr:thylakoid membrane photosystem I accumulation factor [Leptolyngbya sp. FACHB-261]MBD2104203.1 thylakoid membrane photosystem I accumulation factor [Leptolyngbya sp. FACHB-261]